MAHQDLMQCSLGGASCLKQKSSCMFMNWIATRICLKHNRYFWNHKSSVATRTHGAVLMLTSKLKIWECANVGYFSQAHKRHIKLFNSCIAWDCVTSTEAPQHRFITRNFRIKIFHEHCYCWYVILPTFMRLCVCSHFLISLLSIAHCSTVCCTDIDAWNRVEKWLWYNLRFLNHSHK